MLAEGKGSVSSNPARHMAAASLAPRLLQLPSGGPPVEIAGQESGSEGECGRDMGAQPNCYLTAVVVVVELLS